jgi:hypothetical protein
MFIVVNLIFSVSTFADCTAYKSSCETSENPPLSIANCDGLDTEFSRRNITEVTKKEDQKECTKLINLAAICNKSDKFRYQVYYIFVYCFLSDFPENGETRSFLKFDQFSPGQQLEIVVSALAYNNENMNTAAEDDLERYKGEDKWPKIFDWAESTSSPLRHGARFALAENKGQDRKIDRIFVKALLLHEDQDSVMRAISIRGKKNGDTVVNSLRELLHIQENLADRLYTLQVISRTGRKNMESEGQILIESLTMEFQKSNRALDALLTFAPKEEKYKNAVRAFLQSEASKEFGTVDRIRSLSVLNSQFCMN